MGSKVLYALVASLSLLVVFAKGATPPAPSSPAAPAARPAAVSPLQQAINEERAQLASQCAAHGLGAFVRPYPDPQYPDSFQMTTIQCRNGFLVESWSPARLVHGR